MTGASLPADLAVGVHGVLGAFNRAGVLHAGDVHVAARLGALFGESDSDVLLALALAVRAPRLGHVFVDLFRIADTATVDVDRRDEVEALVWPAVGAWLDGVASSPLVSCRGETGSDRPLVLDGTRLYLLRAWADERAVATAVDARVAASDPVRDPVALEHDIARLVGAQGDPSQREAVRTAVTGRFTVICGGPGTGKTTTVAAVLAVLCAEAAAAGVGMPRIAIVAPTGKAAERLGESIAEQAARLPVDPVVRETLVRLEGRTLHRLLGAGRGGYGTRPAPLPDDVVVVDEASMVSLSLMARLIAALREDARLILVGDSGQLASVEAGAVLGDIVGPVADGPVATALGRRITVLRTVHRFGAEIGALADAVRAGDAQRTIDLLGDGGPRIRWIPPEAALRPDGAVATAVVAAGGSVWHAAARGDADAALDASGRVRILCAHRRGPDGVAAWTATSEAWLRDRVEGYAPFREWYVGRPVLVTENDYGLGLFNGDSGVVVATPAGRVVVAFARAGAVIGVSPSRLGAAETVHAMTIHKSQGSQFATAVVVVPDRSSRLLTRELLYTAITRARDELIVVGGEEAIRDAVARPIDRASGLRERLWAEMGP